MNPIYDLPFQDTADDKAYNQAVKTNIPVICEQIASGNFALLDKVVSLAQSHLERPETTPERINCDIILLNQVIAATRSVGEQKTSADSLLPTLPQDVRNAASVLQAQQSLEALKTHQGILQLLSTSHPMHAGHTVASHSDFALLNADFLNLDLDERDPETSRVIGTTTAENGLSLMIGSLQAIRHKLPDHAQSKVDALIKKFQDGWQLISCIHKLSASPLTTKQYRHVEHSLRQVLVSRLKAGQPIFIASGWASIGVGHQITCELTPHIAADGRVTVSGRILNRGEGTQHHKAFIKGKKVAYDPELVLTNVSLADLNNSSFLSKVLQLNFVHPPSDSDYPELGRPIEQLTNFSANDFYNVLMTAWPGKIEVAKKSRSRTAQRGGTCSIKPLMTVVDGALGEELGELARFFMTKHSWETFGLDASREGGNQIRPILRKFVRRAIKLNKKGLLSAPERGAVNALSDAVRENVQRAESLRQQRIDSESTDVVGPLQEKDQYTFTFPDSAPMPQLTSQQGICRLEQKTGGNDLELLILNITALETTDVGTIFNKMRALPNASDAAWLEVNRVRTPFQIQQLVFKITQMKGSSTFSPHRACQLVKLLGIAYRLSENVLPEDIRSVYAHRLKNIIENHLPPLFCPCHPADLHSFRDAIALMSTGAQSRPTPNTFYKKLLGERFIVESNYRQYDSIVEAMADPDLKYLSSFTQTAFPYDRDKYTSDNDKYLRQVGKLYRYERPDVSMTGVPNDYYTLRTLAFLTHVLFTVRASPETDRMNVMFTHPATPYQWTYENRVDSLIPLDPANVGRGIFADAFPALGNDPRAEKFATDLLGKSRVHTRSFTSQSTLNVFHKSELFGTAGINIALDPVAVQNFLSVRTLHALPLPQLEHCFTASSSTSGLWMLEKPYFQSIFLALLFKVNETTLLSPLEEACERRPGSREIDNFFTFLKTSLRDARKTQAWTTYFFLLRVYAMSLSQCYSCRQPTALPDDLLENLEEELKLISRPKTLQVMPADKVTRFNHTLEAMIAYLAEIPPLLPLAQTMQTIRTSLRVTVPDNEAAQDFHFQEDIGAGRYFISIYPHLTVTPGSGFNLLLPPSITNDMLYQFIFKNNNFACEEIGPGAFQFRDSESTLYRIFPNNDPQSQFTTHIFSQHLDSKGNLRWFNFSRLGLDSLLAPDDRRGPSTPFGYLSDGTQNWITSEDPKEVRVMQATTNELLCCVASEQIFHPTERHLILAKNDNHPTLKVLSRIAADTHILAWKNVSTGDYAKFELKRPKLTFESGVNAKGDVCWKCTEYPGYFLDSHAKSAAFEPFSHYIVLVNNQGNRKVVISSKEFRPEKITFPNKPVLAIAGDRLNRLFTYDLTAEGKVVFPDDLLALQYLIYLAFKQQNYPLCFQAIRAIKREMGDWPEKMIVGMSYLNEAPQVNTNPEAVALRLHLHALRLDQSVSGDGAAALNDLIKDDYMSYLNQLNNVPSYQRLSAEEEARLHSAVSRTSLSANEAIVFNDRLIEIQSGSNLSQRMQRLLDGIQRFVPKEPERVPLPFPIHWMWLSLDQSLQEKMIAALEQPNSILPQDFTLRPGKAFVTNFLYYYRVLQQQQDGSLRALIHQLLNDCCYSKDPSVQDVRAALLHVAQSPLEFPPVESLIKDGRLNFGPLFSKERQPLLELPAFERAIGNISTGGIERSDATLQSTRPANHAFMPARFADIPDSLLNRLRASGGIQERLPREADISAMKQDLVYLHEMRRFYRTKAHHDDPAIAAEFRRIADGVTEFCRELEEQLHDTERIVNFSDVSQVAVHERRCDFVDDELDSTIADLFVKAESATRNLGLLKEQITEQLHECVSADLLMEMHGSLVTPLTFEEALVHFGRCEDAPFYAANPGLTPHDLKKLKKSIGRYLIHQLNTQKSLRLMHQLKDARQILHAKGADSADYLVAKSNAVDTLNAQRAYEPHAAPHLLVYEFFTDCCLRAEQIQALDLLTKGELADDVIFEARTGFGKSKALIPLWLYLTGRARKEEQIPGVAMMTVPAPLFAQEIDYLKKVLGGAFEQSVYAFRFNRAKGHDIDYLRQLNKRLDQAAAAGTCVLTTVDSLHGSLELKIEELLDKGPTEENVALLTELRVLRQKMGTHLSNFFDESRECFDIRTYYDYAIGQPKAVPKEDCQRIGTLYGLLLTLDPPIAFDFLPGAKSDEQPHMNEERYHREVKGPLAAALMEHYFATHTLPTPNATDKELLLRYLEGQYDSRIDPYLDSLSLEQQRQLDKGRKQLNSFLPRTLTRPCNGRYGLAMNQTGHRQAYPMDRGVVKLTSQFSTTEDLLNFTVQANLQTPFSVQELTQFINSLKFALEKADDKDEFKQKNANYRLYLKLVAQIPGWPKKLSGCSENDIHHLVAVLNDPKNIKLRLLFITEHILPAIKIYPKKVSSTAHELVEAMERVYGASGTINTDTLTPRLRTIEHLTTPVRSLLALWRNSQDAIHVVPNQEAHDLLATSVAKHPEYIGIVDAAGSFCDIRDERRLAKIIFAQTAGRNPPIQGISYYDDEGRNRVFLRPQGNDDVGESIAREDCLVSKDNLFIFMRQRAAIGADTPMPMTARLLVTVDGETQRELFSQAIGRPRNLFNGQRVAFLIQQKDAAALADGGERVTLKSILFSVGCRQGEQNGENLVFNLTLLLDYFASKPFWRNFVDPAYSLKNCFAAFAAKRDFFVQNTAEEPLLSMKQSSGDVPIEAAVAHVKESFVRKMRDMLTPQEMKSILATFDQLVDFSKLPKVVKMGSVGDADREVEMDQTAEAAEDVENEAEQQSSRENTTTVDLPSVSYTPAEPKPSQSYRTLGIAQDEISTQFPEKYAKLLEGFHASTNYFRIARKWLLNRDLPRPRELLMTSYQYLLVGKPRRYRVVLMEQQDTRTALTQMARARDFTREDYYLMSSSGKVITQDATDDFDPEAFESNPRLTFLTKIFTHQWNFTRVEKQYLRSLSRQERELLFEFLHTQVATCWASLGPVLTQLKAEIV